MQKAIWAPCNNCGRETKHSVLHSELQTERDEQYGAWWETTFRMLKCLGCEDVVLERAVQSSEFQEIEKNYYPPGVVRRKPRWAANRAEPIGPRGLLELLNEVYIALHANSRRLATMGARTLLDMVMVDKIGDVGSFHAKLKAFEAAGFVASQQSDILDAALEAGSASAHRGHHPSEEDLESVMDIIEGVISQVYVFPKAAKSLRKSTPKRKK